MPGIYIHIPYCRQACHYCNFHFSTSLQSIGDMTNAIIKELSLRKEYLNDFIETIYFGGGTPSLIPSEQLQRILNEINNTYKIKHDVEITLEANPEDINNRKARELSELGINRISLGVQSFDDKILQKLNRAHSKAEAIDAIQILQKSGFENLTVDLIYGIPGQSLSRWEENLAQINNLNIPHLSCYALTIEEKTAFGQWRKSGKMLSISDDKYEEEYKIMCSFLAAEGYEHYEVSNFAKPLFKSRHNSSYWQQEPYLGLGPGAHSYNRQSRQYNVSNNATYIKALAKNELPCEIEFLSESQVYNEYILTGLRTNQGINLQHIKNEFGYDLLKTNEIFINRCLNDNQVILQDNKLVLTDSALILADSLIIELMIDPL